MSNEREERLASLVEREPRLAQLVAAANAIDDPGTSAFFCANHAFLPLSVQLRELLGPMRRGGGDPELLSFELYREIYELLAANLPPCRDCGCRRFAEHRRAETEALGSEGSW